MQMLSGASWVAMFPASRSEADLAEPFRTKAKAFLAALRTAGANVVIAETRRPTQRAYLMHYAFAIARMGTDPATVPPMEGVEIEWAHADPASSRAAAEAMVEAYGIVHEPVLDTRHTEGLAMDMNVAWQGSLRIAKGNGAMVTIAGLPREGSGNLVLHAIGASYGVFKLATDPPHWSSDGH